MEEQSEELRELDFFFQRVTEVIRKPSLRFRLPSGREVELLGLHLEPAWRSREDSALRMAKEVVSQIYPNCEPVFLGEFDSFIGPAYLCIVSLCSNKEARKDVSANCSYLTACMLISDINEPVRNIVTRVLARVDWDSHAENEFLW